MRPSIKTNNASPRKLICISTQKDVWGGANGERLELNKVYNAVRIDEHKWNTDVYLQEFPGIAFNSVLFGEYEEINGRLVNFMKEIDIENLPNLLLTGEYLLQLSNYKKEIEDLEVGKRITFGRRGCDITIGETDPCVSRVHCFVEKDRMGRIFLYDCSLNGTKILK